MFYHITILDDCIYVLNFTIMDNELITLYTNCLGTGNNTQLLISGKLLNWDDRGISLVFLKIEDLIEGLRGCGMDDEYMELKEFIENSFRMEE